MTKSELESHQKLLSRYMEDLEWRMSHLLPRIRAIVVGEAADAMQVQLLRMEYDSAVFSR